MKKHIYGSQTCLLLTSDDVLGLVASFFSLLSSHFLSCFWHELLRLGSVSFIHVRENSVFFVLLVAVVKSGLDIMKIRGRNPMTDRVKENLFRHTGPSLMIAACSGRKALCAKEVD